LWYKRQRKRGHLDQTRVGTKMKFNFTFAVLVAFFSVFSHARKSTYVPDIIAENSLQEIALSALEYSFKDQVASADKNYLPGEFRTKIQSTLVPALVGVGKAFGQDDEATAFTTASVVNILGPVYLRHPELKNTETFKKIPLVIASAVKTFSRYKSGNTYNFYPPKVLDNGQIVRRPIDMTLFPLWFGFTNIPNDSDSTSAILTSLLYDGAVNASKQPVDINALNEFSVHLDLNRNPMYYNRFEKRIKTGAFMTWLLNERDPNMPRFFFAESEAGARIPFNKNDVDCVVNANILKLLALAKRSTPGDSSACEMLNDMIARDESSSCGIYYPNTYNLGYALAGIKANGGQCLKKENESNLITKLINEQTAEGSWINENIWKDPVLSTTFAMTALLEFGDLNELPVRRAAFYGIHFLLKSARIKNQLINWPEDNFFTATAIARSLIMWRSKAFTNASIAAVLLRFHQIYPDYRAKNYIGLNF
jgi:hypothetical protein